MPKNSSFFQKKKRCINEKMASKAKKIQLRKKWCIRLTGYAIIKKASQDGQQNQSTTTTTTNINYIKKFMSVLKKT